MQKELVISPREGTPFAISEYLGKVVVIAFISKAACLTGPSLELVDQLLLEIGPTQFMSVACIVDLEPDEAVREYSPFLIPIGATPRRQEPSSSTSPCLGSLCRSSCFWIRPGSTAIYFAFRRVTISGRWWMAYGRW